MNEDHAFVRVLIAAGLYKPSGRPPAIDLSGLPSATAGDPAAARYAAAALRSETQAVASAPEGTRNDTLNRAAFKLATLTAAGHLDGRDVVDRLSEAARSAGLLDSEISATLRSGIGAGSRLPRKVVLDPHRGVADGYTVSVDGSEEPAAPAGGVDGAEEPAAPANGMAARILTRAQLAQLPKPEPLIGDTLDLGTVTVLAGYWGTCKSFIAQDWAACIATGKRWQARTVEQGAVLYVAAEGAHGLDARLAAWEVCWQQDISAETFSVLPVAVQLGRAGDVAELCDVVTSGGYRFVVIDTLAKCMVGLDENSAQDMGRIVHALYLIRSATGDGTVLGVHHTGKDRLTIRGSSALEGGVDTVYTTEGDPRLIKLTRTKRKDGPTHDAHTLMLSRVEHTDSAVIEIAGDASLTDRQRELMTVFRSAFSETGASKVDLRNAAGMPSATFHRAVNALVSDGKLINEGTMKRPFYRAGGAC